MEHLEQSALIKEAMRGNTECFAAAVHRIRDRSYHIAYSYLQNEQDSMDAVCDAVEKALLNLKKLKEPEYFNTWFTQIVINQCKMQLRKSRRLRYANEEELSEEAVITAISKEEKMDLEQIISRFPPTTRLLLQLKFFQGYTLEEIADMTELAIGTVKTKIYSSLKVCRTYLATKEET